MDACMHERTYGCENETGTPRESCTLADYGTCTGNVYPADAMPVTITSVCVYTRYNRFILARHHREIEIEQHTYIIEWMKL